MGKSGNLGGLQRGEVLGRRFEIRRQIGTGRIGTVYWALDQNLDEELAIRVITPQLVADVADRQRLTDEAQLVIKLTHPKIVDVHDVLFEDGLIFITMEYLEGRSLRLDMDARRLLNRPYSIKEALAIMRSLCDALTYAHEYTVHRDIKPQNVWLTVDDQVKLMDFSIATRPVGNQTGAPIVASGAAYYIAPEQLSGNREADARSDQYALGVMLYELLTGQVPMGRSKSVQQIRKDVSASVSDAIDRALAHNPQDRHADIAAFALALGLDPSGANAAGRDTAADRVESPGWKTWVNQHRRLVSGVAVVWAAILGGAHLLHVNSVAPNKIKWDEWQTEMAAAFKRIEGSPSAPAARTLYWKVFLVVYAKNNPFSGDDEDLRTKAASILRSIDPEHARDAVRVSKDKPAAAEREKTKVDEMYDQRTNKTWQRCSVGQNWDSLLDVCSGESERLTWEEMRKLEKGGWRVPKSDEFRTYLQNPSAFPSLSTPSLGDSSPPTYWTADGVRGGKGWIADFSEGANRQADLGDNHAVRLIRNGR